MNEQLINTQKDIENKNITYVETTKEINKTDTLKNNHPYATNYILEPEVISKSFCEKSCNISKSE